jgi:ribonuclease E
VPAPVEPAEEPAAEKPKRRSRKKVVAEAPADVVTEAAPAVVTDDEPVAEPPRPAPAAPVVEPVVPEPEPVAIVLSEVDPNRPRRGGWWSKK